MWDIEVTLDVSHTLKSWLKLDAYINMYSMFVTRDVFHLEISELKVSLSPKPVKSNPSKPVIFVTRLTSHFGMTPYFVLESPYSSHKPSMGASLKHASTASKKVASVKQ